MGKMRKTNLVEADLRDKRIGTIVDSLVEKEAWQFKLYQYDTLGVGMKFKRLVDSFNKLFKDAEGKSDIVMSNNAAQKMMDRALIRRARTRAGGYNKAMAKIPEKVVEYKGVDEAAIDSPNAEPTATKPKEHVELIDPTVFAGKKEVSINQQIKWVKEHLMSSTIKEEDALSAGSWYMLMHYRATAQRREKFYDTQVPKLLSKETGDAGGKLQDSGKPTIELCERLLAACTE